MSRCLVLGGNGFIAQPVIKNLVAHGNVVRTIDRTIPDDSKRISGVEYCNGDIYDTNLLNRAFEGSDIVYDFVSTTMPNSNSISAENEINSTLRYYDYILSSMYTAGIKNYVFPSSGGAVYGDINECEASESNELKPLTTYGLGKCLSEQLIEYYCRRLGMNSCILRIGNVYGSMSYRFKNQGVIDIFVQKALENKEICIWGKAENSIRDYIHLDDVSDAIVTITEKQFCGVNIYNIASGKGTSLKHIIDIIQEKLGRPIQICYKNDQFSGINRIILSIEKIKKDYGWQPQISIEQGIEKTIMSKQEIINSSF